MNTRTYTIRELLEAAAKGYPSLWKVDGSLNLNAVARFLKQHGHPISQPTLLRLSEGEHEEPKGETVEALHSVFRIPRNMLRGEPMTAELEQLLVKYPLATLFIAERLARLPKEDFENICRLIETATEKNEQLRRAQRDGNVTPIDRPRR